MPLPSVFQGVQDCRLPGLKPPKRFQPSRRPPRQQLLQLHAPAIYFSRGSIFQGVQDCRLRQQLLQLLHAPVICFSGGSRLPFARPQTPQTLPTLPQASKATTLTATCPCHRFYFSRGSRLPFAWPQTLQTLPQASKATTLTATYMPLPSVFQGVQARPHTLRTLPQASKATTLTATCPCHLFFRGFKTPVCPASNSPNASNPPAGLQGNNSYLQLLHAPAICFSGGSRLPFARPQTPQTLPTLPQASKATTLILQLLHAPAICFSGGSRLPFARPQTPQTLPTLPQASKATTLTATCPCHLFFRGFKTAVCLASNPPNASAGFQGNNSYSYIHAPAICFSGGSSPPSHPPNASAGFQGNNSYSYMSLPSVFQGVQDCRLPGLKPPKRFQPSRRPPRQQLLQLHAPAIYFSRGSRLPFARPQTPQTLPTLPQASKATTLTATTCPCHLFFRGFKTAVCPASNPQNASNPPAGLQGNNSYSYMPLPSIFQGVQDCRLRQQLLQLLHAPVICFSGGSRLPFARPQTRRPPRQQPRQQLLQLHAPAICFSGGSRLPFARPQTPQTLPTLPQASKATTLAATCPCHLFFKGFKTAVCLASNPPNASAGFQGNNSYSYIHAPAICFSGGSSPPSHPPNASAGFQGNNSYSYMSLPSVFQGVQDSRLPGLKPPKRFQPSRRPPRQQLLSYSYYMPLPSVFQGVQDCRLPGLKPPKRFQPSRRPPRQQLLLSLSLSLSLCLSLSLSCPFPLFFGNWTLSWGLHPVAGRSWKTRSTKHELFSGSYESQEERDVICCGIPSKQSWLLRLWSPGAVLVKFQVAYPCFFGNTKARSCVSLTI